MLLTRHKTSHGARWALDAKYLPLDFSLGRLLDLPRHKVSDMLLSLPAGDSANGLLLAPIEPQHEVWACGVTYLRSREARELESETADIYTKVYNATRPEIFFKGTGWRVVGHLEPIRVRQDSRWNVPEPELTLVINSELEILGYCAGNDVCSRDIEGQNPLYLPQAKFYDGSCALGPGILLAGEAELADLTIGLKIFRDSDLVYQDQVSTSQMKRNLKELVAALGAELSFPQGVFLMTGAGIVPPEHFSLQPGDNTVITVGALEISNTVAGQ